MDELREYPGHYLLPLTCVEEGDSWNARWGVLPYQTKGKTMRNYKSGATRDDDSNKLSYEGFYSPIVMKRFAEYMHENQTQADGKKRSADNWQKGIPKQDYIDSGYRHFIDWCLEHDGFESREGLEKALCGILFNVQGYLFEILKERYDG